MKVSALGLLGPDSSPNRHNKHGKRARRRLPAVARPLEDLAHKTGPPLTTGELAHIIGMSSSFIRKEIHNGYLKAVRIGRGRKCVFRIAGSEARRYLGRLGLL